jgi:N-acyl amino acid synthase of PEP-CTERM/exosortase system
MDYTFKALHYSAFLKRAEFGAEETVDHVHRQIFRVYPGHLPAEIPNEIFKLRYDVYCVECAFLPHDDSFEGLEFDDFDDCSTHFAAYTMEESLTGTVRLVQPHGRRPFPFELHCNTFPNFVMPERAECGEVSRLAVKRAHRRRRADSVLGIPGFLAGHHADTACQFSPEVERRDRRSPMLLLGMYREMFRHSRVRGVRYWFAAMERSLAHSLAKIGFHFEPIGPVADYYGSVTPYVTDLDVLIERLEQNNPALGAWFSEKPLVFAERRAARWRMCSDAPSLPAQID